MDWKISIVGVISMDLNSIENPKFLENLNNKELKSLCEDIRKFLIENISKTGGHLASNLGVVELTVGLHKVFNNENDKLIFDVGHQAYTHKILTGRAKDFATLRQTNGLNGFTNYDESSYDCWESGHSSNSISAQAGFLLAKKEGKPINDVVSIIGDSSIANGMAFEGLNFVSTIDGVRPIIILNDNTMGISKSVGATAKLFNVMRSTKFYRFIKRALIFINPPFIVRKFHQIKRAIKSLIQSDNMFEDIGFDYYGPYDGNDIKTIIKVLERVKKSKKPCLVHFITKKGLGYSNAEDDELGTYHGIGPFNIETGKPLKVYKENEYSYSEIIAKGLIELRAQKKFIVINPATMVGNRLNKFQKLYPDSIYDVGIAEEHATTMAGALALNGVPVALLMYSTFAQRAYDQFLNDIARRNLPVIIGLDRSGLVAEDGSTHQGIYDVAAFKSMPNVQICMGKNLAEAKALIKFAFSLNKPVVVRYPKLNEEYSTDVEINSTAWEEIFSGTKAIVITYGPDVLRIKHIIEENKLDIMLINARFINPIDDDLLEKLFSYKLPIYVIEQVIKDGSLGESIADIVATKKLMIDLKQISIPTDSYIPQASLNDLQKMFKLDDEALTKELKNYAI